MIRPFERRTTTRCRAIGARRVQLAAGPGQALRRALGCHRAIDPWGVPLENFDAVGLWRTKVVKPGPKRGRKKGCKVETAVDATSTLPGGKKISGVNALKRHLLTIERGRFSRAVVKKMFAYALGRSAELTDRVTIDRLTKQFAAKGYKLSDLIVGIVLSQEFRTK